MRVPFSNLDRQFHNIDSYLDKIRSYVQASDFSVEKETEKLEERFAQFCKAPFAISVKNGTDALAICLKMLGIERGDEVVVCAMTHVSILGAIVQTGAKPVLVDCTENLVIDPEKIEQVITEKTKAILAIHYAGNIADMAKLRKIADEYQLVLLEEASQALGSYWKAGQPASLSDAACFGFGPMNSFSTWSDGGMIITHNDELAEKARLYRNEGLISRDEALMFGVNSCLDCLQVLVASQLIEEMDHIIKMRSKKAQKYDAAFLQLQPYVSFPVRKRGIKQVYDQYVILAKDRDELYNYLRSNGIEGKILYATPAHLQRATDSLGYQEGDFPVCERSCQLSIALPIHQNLTENELQYVITHIQNFYQNKLSDVDSAVYASMAKQTQLFSTQ